MKNICGCLVGFVVLSVATVCAAQDESSSKDQSVVLNNATGPDFYRPFYSSTSLRSTRPEPRLRRAAWINYGISIFSFSIGAFTAIGIERDCYVVPAAYSAAGVCWMNDMFFLTMILAGVGTTFLLIGAIISIVRAIKIRRRYASRTMSAPRERSFSSIFS